MIKLYKARSLLYRRQILQENIRWKALDEIHKIYMLLHRSDNHISEKNHLKMILQNQNFAHSLMKFYRNFANIFENVEKNLILNLLKFLANCTDF